VGQALGRQRGEDDVATLEEALARLLLGEPVEAQFDRRDPAADAEVEAAAAEVIEHADLLGQPQRVVLRERVDQRAEPQTLAVLRGGGEKDARRRREAERRPVVLGKVVAVETAAIVGADQLEPVGVLRTEIGLGAIHVIEHAELHLVSTAVGEITVIPRSRFLPSAAALSVAAGVAATFPW
jgi:hypothetical protein